MNQGNLNLKKKNLKSYGKAHLPLDMETDIRLF